MTKEVFSLDVHAPISDQTQTSPSTKHEATHCKLRIPQKIIPQPSNSREQQKEPSDGQSLQRHIGHLPTSFPISLKLYIVRILPRHLSEFFFFSKGILGFA